jgi:hypothetical protein
MLTEEMEYLKKQTSYALEYTGYTLWWWGSRVLEAGLGWAARKTHGAHMWSVGAANQILGKRTRLGQEKESVKDQAEVKEASRQGGKDFTSAEEALILDEE